MRDCKILEDKIVGVGTTLYLVVGGYPGTMDPVPALVCADSQADAMEFFAKYIMIEEEIEETPFHWPSFVHSVEKVGEVTG